MRIRVRDVVRALLAVAALGLLVVGVPAALVIGVGSPLPRELPSAAEIGRALGGTEISDTLIIKSLAVVVWLGWAQLVACVVVEAVAAVRARRAARVPLSGPIQALAGRLVASALLVSSLSSARPALASPPLSTVLANTSARVVAEGGRSPVDATEQDAVLGPAPRQARRALSAAWCSPGTTSGTWPRPICAMLPASPTRSAGRRSSS